MRSPAAKARSPRAVRNGSPAASAPAACSASRTPAFSAQTSRFRCARIRLDPLARTAIQSAISAARASSPLARNCTAPCAS